MKIRFRRKDNGQIFDYTSGKVCGEHDFNWNNYNCKNCPAYEYFPHEEDSMTECDEFIMNNPFKFAELMGLELVEYQLENADVIVDRKSILENAIKCVCGDGDKQYGNPEDNFAKIAEYWSAYLGKEINAVDVAMMMSLFKIARIQTGTGTLDSFIDLAGYAACGGEIACKEE